MSKKLSMIVPTGILIVLLSVAPTIAQDARDTGAGNTPTTSRVDNDEDGPDLGWLGLLGLIGLAGLMRRDRHNHTVDDKHLHR
jgi:MYXO-CTERM domain-containing protein